ncbi:hypothetical protein BDR03DRAFT_964263, partial [Suillus americanus]
MTASSLGLTAAIIIAYLSTVRLILRGTEDIIYVAAVVVVDARLLHFRTCTDKRYRCCQRNNDGEEEETHCLCEV